MKKLLLLFAAGAIASTSFAQERLLTFGNDFPVGTKSSSSLRNVIRTEVDNNKHQQKTTAAPRWYSYASNFDTTEKEIGNGAAIAAHYLWKDTMAVMPYGTLSAPTWSHNRLVSVGAVTDPSYSGFNRFDYYPGEMKVTSADAYTVDSLRFFGVYGFNVANTYVDTIRVAFVYGNGSRGNGTSGPDVYLAKTGNPAVLTTYGSSDSMDTYRIHFDANTGHAKGTAVIVKDVILDNTGASPAWGDTLSDGTYMGRIGFPDVNVPAGNLIGATISFISGSPTFTPHDTAFLSSGIYKYNMFRPYSIFKGSGTTPMYATYSAANRNSGMYKTLPDTSLGWGGQYIPLWFWSSSGGASTYQYPYVDFHVKCPSCGVIVGVQDIARIQEASVFPNPADDQLSVPFTLGQKADVTVSLSNLLGQVVDLRSYQGVEKGKAVFNTASLPSGVYQYTVAANGEKLSGKVVITH